MGKNFFLFPRYAVIMNKNEYNMGSKKLLIFSDTHGDVSTLKAVFEWAKNQLPPAGTSCATVFLGDGISDLQRAANAAGFCSEWKIVSGNNDYNHSIPETAVFDFADHRFFMCHGHRYKLHNGYHSLRGAARTANADVALFGHSHIPYHQYVDGLWLINPGSIGQPRGKTDSTFAVIECADNAPLKTEFWEIGGQGIIREIII